MSSSSILSETLRSITVTKIRELEKQRAQYESRKIKILDAAKECNNQQERIGCLLRGVKELYRGREGDASIDNVDGFLAQSRYDASVPSRMLQDAEDLLRSKLEVQSRKLGMAHLYSRLVTEWTSPGNPMEGGVAAASMKEDSSFEVIDRQRERLESLCDQFEQLVFTPFQTDETEINEYLSEMFSSDTKMKALQILRDHMGRAGEEILSVRNPFDETTLRECIKGLLEQDLLSDEKQAILQEFNENDVVLREIADVLNMRFAEIENWEWDAGEEGIPLLPRQQLNGKYRIWMDEDVLQAIFIHFIGVKTCSELKKGLEALISRSGDEQVWRWHAGSSLTEGDAQRRAYYLGAGFYEGSYSHRRSRWSNLKARGKGVPLDTPARPDIFGTVAAHRKKNYTKNFFVAALPSHVNSLNNGMYANDGEVSEEEYNTESDQPADKSSANIKQCLLRTLAAEIMIQQSLYGKAAVVQSDLKWFGASLSHTTIFVVMRFFGFPESLLAFYKKVLEAPLSLSPSSGFPAPDGPRTRRRGMPMARAPEKLIGELILFVMDFAVNQETGLQLYRLHDDLWVVGSPFHTARAWGAMKRFAAVMGLEFNAKKTGSVYLVDGDETRDEAIAAELPCGPVNVGHLVLDPKSGRWIIDQENVDQHVSQLRKQLAESRSVLDWVRTWNSCISRFFSHTFGEPAFCFGRDHVESILRTYQKMQRDIFAPLSKDSDGNSESESNFLSRQQSAVHYLKRKIEERFGITDLSDAFILFPERLGGLGLRNPFISFLMSHESLSLPHNAASEIIANFFQAEKEEYALRRSEFEATTTFEEREERSLECHPRLYVDDVFRPGESEKFFSFEEYIAHRELTSSELGSAYVALQQQPTARRQQIDDEVESTLEEVAIRPAALASEMEWVMQMYRRETKEKFDGLRLVEKSFLPLGVVAMMNKKTVRWGLVL
ncbi:hypothetical protein CCHL11_04489 [Colletotrichum chlorophyti]|uniref:Reverse transcriptase domain-containing protein n=1 Tax=Colletotrichum chlorophyti TaxID=708187 RepID=A0A1Q8S4E0_9PEZI|nr:hypothetical protein CCHL11_04489 [Colletotrichum chlorophyti]